MEHITAKEAYQTTMKSINKHISKRDAKWVDRQIRKTAEKGKWSLRLEREWLKYSKSTIENHFQSLGFYCLVDSRHILIDWSE